MEWKMKIIYCVAFAILSGVLGGCSSTGSFIKYEGSTPNCDKLRSPDSQLQTPVDPLALEKDCQSK